MLEATREDDVAVEPAASWRHLRERHANLKGNARLFGETKTGPIECTAVRPGVGVLMPNEQSGDQASASPHSFGDASSTQLPAGSRT